MVVDESVPEFGDCGTLAEVGRVEGCKDMGRNLLGEVGHGVLFVHKRCAWRWGRRERVGQTLWEWYGILGLWRGVGIVWVVACLLVCPFSGHGGGWMDGEGDEVEKKM